MPQMKISAHKKIIEVIICFLNLRFFASDRWAKNGREEEAQRFTIIFSTLNAILMMTRGGGGKKSFPLRQHKKASSSVSHSLLYSSPSSHLFVVLLFFCCCWCCCRYLNNQLTHGLSEREKKVFWNVVQFLFTRCTDGRSVEGKKLQKREEN